MDTKKSQLKDQDTTGRYKPIKASDSMVKMLRSVVTALQSMSEFTNQTSAGNPKLTTSDIQDIRKTLDEVRKDIVDGKAIEALKQINQIDDKLLDAMSKNPPPMLQKSTGNDNK